MSRRAVIVSTARTGLTKSFRSGFNNTHGAVMQGHAIKHAIEKAGISPGDVEDVIIGCGFPEGATGMNIARNAALWAGCPVTTSGTTINRFCSSGLQAVASAAHSVMVDGVDVAIGGGVESISMVSPVASKTTVTEEKLMSEFPALWMPMIETADIVSARYGISREAQDVYSVESQRRTAAAQEAGLFKDEIVPMKATMLVTDKETGETSHKTVLADRDECNRPGTTLEALAGMNPVRSKVDPSAFITAGNASQLSDGASACVVMSEAEASRRGLQPLGAFKGFAVAGCAPDEMGTPAVDASRRLRPVDASRVDAGRRCGTRLPPLVPYDARGRCHTPPLPRPPSWLALAGIGPVFAVPRLLARHGLKVDDIDLWELNEAFAVVPLYSMQQLGIDHAKTNVNGGSIAIGHPFGMTGSRMVGHALLEGKRRGAKSAVVTMCIGGGMGAAGLFEIF